MIALCREHADQADNGAFTDDQLRKLKRVGREKAREVRGRFNWMRQALLAVVGGNFYYEQPVILQIGDVKCIWFDRDDEGYLQLNFKMPTITGCPRAEIEQNFWRLPPDVDEIICPPSGRLVEVSYHNGDKFRAEFFNVASSEMLESRYPEANVGSWSDRLEFPLTVVELWETAAGTPIELGPSFSRLERDEIRNSFFMGDRGGAIIVAATEEELPLFFPQEDKSYLDKDIYLTDLLGKHERSCLQGFTFTRCRIYGPAVVYLFGAPNSFSGCHFQDSVGSIFLEVPDGSSRVGCVQLVSCRFTDCRIQNMAIIGTREQLAIFQRMLSSR